MLIITTVGIRSEISSEVYPFAEQCRECGEFLPIEGYRNWCYRCV